MFNPSNFFGVHFNIRIVGTFYGSESFYINKCVYCGKLIILEFMEYTLLILLLLIMIWINLRNKISKSQEKTEELLKEIAALRKRLENSPEVVDEIKEPEPEILKEPEVFVQPEPVRAIVEPAKILNPRRCGSLSIMRNISVRTYSVKSVS